LIVAGTNKTSSLQLSDVDEFSFYCVSLDPSLESTTTTELEHEVADIATKLQEDFVLIRTRSEFALSFSCKMGQYQDNATAALFKITENLNCDRTLLIVSLPKVNDEEQYPDGTKTSVIIGANINKNENITYRTMCGGFEDNKKQNITDKKPKQQKSKQIEEKRSVPSFLNVSTLTQISSTKDVNVHAPTFQFIPLREGESVESMKLVADVCGYIPFDTALHTLTNLILEKVRDQLKGMARMMSEDRPSVPTPYHFRFPKIPHLFTTIYPITKNAPQNSRGSLETEADFADVRAEYHRRLLLPMDRPLLRCGNALTFTPTGPMTEVLPLPADQLRDVHQTIVGSQQSRVQGRMYLVQGSYLYYHYGQKDVDDRGWGCAYRSLQTLCSWMLLQGYTNSPVPSLTDVQKILVQLKDKPANFVGSNNWIGAFEVNLCLNHLYGVSCKILNVASGSELASKGRELAIHFETEGTPIMIGGGVLAYTLLGVDFNENTGEIKFLILDPHYVGPENIKTIKQSGWCGWKGADLFRKDAFYNLCMPLRPRKI
jgi:hypothetical protein